MSVNQDQMWLWKVEPESPRGASSLGEEDDVWLNFEAKTEDINTSVEDVMYDERPTRAQVATKLLEELDEWVKEEPLSDWLEQKIDLPIFEDFGSPECGQNKAAVYPAIGKLYQQDTETMLQEFESVLGNVGACHQVKPSISATLTPPQSPPPSKLQGIVDTQLLITLQPVQPVALSTCQHQSMYQTMTIPLGEHSSPIGQIPAQCNTLPMQWNAENVSLEPLGDVSSDLAAVDELVRSWTEDISPASPCTSSGASCMSSEDSVDDPEWMPESSAASSNVSLPVSSKSRRKPYSRPNVEDKKVRKKEQNKNAATRYRQKKKQEIEEKLGEEREEIDRNDKLRNQVTDLQREIRYLKGLMKDVFKAKGLIK